VLFSSPTPVSDCAYRNNSACLTSLILCLVGYPGSGLVRCLGDRLRLGGVKKRIPCELRVARKWLVHKLEFNRRGIESFCAFLPGEILVIQCTASLKNCSVESRLSSLRAGGFRKLNRNIYISSRCRSHSGSRMHFLLLLASAQRPASYSSRCGIVSCTTIE
jgi:hypothetical protein